MWKYRNSGILSGWNGAVLVIAFFAGLTAFFVVTVLENEPDVPLPAFAKALPFVLPPVMILTGWLIFRHRVHDDDEYRQATVEPEWYRLRADSEIIEGMRGSCKTWFFVILIVTAVFLLILLFSLLDGKLSDAVNRGVFAAGAALALLINLRNVLRWQFWRHPPEELEYTEIPVAYSTEQTYQVRGGRRKCIKMYFFLPAGRYCVVNNGVTMEYSAPETLYFVRWHGIVRWAHWED